MFLQTNRNSGPISVSLSSWARVVGGGVRFKLRISTVEGLDLGTWIASYLIFNTILQKKKEHFVSTHHLNTLIFFGKYMPSNLSLNQAKVGNWVSLWSADANETNRTGSRFLKNCRWRKQTGVGYETTALLSPQHLTETILNNSH